MDSASEGGKRQGEVVAESGGIRIGLVHGPGKSPESPRGGAVSSKQICSVLSAFRALSRGLRCGRVESKCPTSINAREPPNPNIWKCPYLPQPSLGPPKLQPSDSPFPRSSRGSRSFEVSNSAHTPDFQAPVYLKPPLTPLYGRLRHLHHQTVDRPHEAFHQPTSPTALYWPRSEVISFNSSSPFTPHRPPPSARLTTPFSVGPFSVLPSFRPHSLAFRRMIKSSAPRLAWMNSEALLDAISSLGCGRGTVTKRAVA